MNLSASIGAFFSNPLQFIVNPANTVLEYQAAQAHAAGTTQADFDLAMEGEGFKKGNLLSEIIGDLKPVLIIVLIIIALYFLIPIVMKKAIR